MSDEIKVLQLGTEDWKKTYFIPPYLELTFSEEFCEESHSAFDLVFADRPVKETELSALCKVTKAHTLYVTEDMIWNDVTKEFYARKAGKQISKRNIQLFLLEEARNYFSKPYGEKFSPKNLAVAQGFPGRVYWNGYENVLLEGDFGQELTQAVYWRNNIPVLENQAIELWLEYEKDPGIEIALSVTQFVQGTVSGIQQQWYFPEKDLEDVVIIDNHMPQGSVFISLLAKGKGKLKVIALNDRYSRRGHGTFLPGGQRFVTSNREELFYYFDPGDLKPPLAVYFSGYKTMQGFEAYHMIRSMGCPFLLLAEPRIEGGSFYLGNEEYEKAVPDIIKKHMMQLGFTDDQVIMSGLSMGAFGAMYYGCDLLPHAIILGKPLLNLGTVAGNERLHRPGGFPTSLDVLHFATGGTDETSIEVLNRRFWNKFDATVWNNTKIIAAYMLEDDYEADAYHMLVSHINDSGLQIYGKGIHGRHNDESSAVVEWFKNQFNKVLLEDFSRKAGL